MTAPLQQHPVLVVDFGAQYAQLIARRVREANLYSEVVPHTMATADVLAKQPAAIILSGGPSSVYADEAPRLDPDLLEAGVPVLGICYGFQAMVGALGGEVDHTGLREYGATQVQISAPDSSTLFTGQPEQQSVWMSHGDSASQAPAGVQVTASSPGAEVAAFEDDERRLYGVQWHPEVVHSTFGQRVIENFLLRGAKLDAAWTPAAMVEELVDQVRETVGTDRAICALSGGVDSSVAAALVQRAIGDQLTCVFVDHGLLREGEAEQVQRDFVEATGVDLVVVEAKDRYLAALAGVSDPEEKRKIIGREFIRVFEQAARDIVQDRGDEQHPVKWLVQGTLYPDVVESGGGTGAANIKSHHNVGGLPDDIQFKLVEPLRVGVHARQHVIQGLPHTGRAMAQGEQAAPAHLHLLRAAEAVYIGQVRVVAARQGLNAAGDAAEFGLRLARHAAAQSAHHPAEQQGHAARRHRQAAVPVAQEKAARLALLVPGQLQLAALQHPPVLVAERGQQHLAFERPFERMPGNIEKVRVAAALAVAQHVFPVRIVPALNAHVVGHEVHDDAQPQLPCRRRKAPQPRQPPEFGIDACVVGHVVTVGAARRARPDGGEVHRGHAQSRQIRQLAAGGGKGKPGVQLQAVGGAGQGDGRRLGGAFGGWCGHGWSFGVGEVVAWGCRAAPSASSSTSHPLAS